jgi:hypothetical protein
MAVSGIYIDIPSRVHPSEDVVCVVQALTGVCGFHSGPIFLVLGIYSSQILKTTIQ